MPGHNRNSRNTGRTIQVAVRLPTALYAALRAHAAASGTTLAAVVVQAVAGVVDGHAQVGDVGQPLAQVVDGHAAATDQHVTRLIEEHVPVGDVVQGATLALIGPDPATGS